MAANFSELTDEIIGEGEEFYLRVNSKNCQQPVPIQGKHIEHCQSQSFFIRIGVTLGMRTIVT